MIDPDFKSIIEDSKGNPDISRLDYKEARELMNDAMLAVSGNKIDIPDVRDFSIKLDGRILRARLYNSKKLNDGIVYFHGGGFISGSIDTHDNLCRLISMESGLKVISVDYRLAPESRFPAAVKDALDSFEYIYNKRDEFGISGRLGTAGDSSGANIAAALCLFSRDNKLKTPDVQVLFYPSLAPDNFSKSFMDFYNGYNLTGSAIEYFGSAYMHDKTDVLNPYFSPVLEENFQNIPPAIIISGENDPLRDPAEAYYKKLRNNGIRAIGIRALGMIHGFATDFNISETAKNLVIMVSKMIPEFMKQ
ncbi:MULTISPECIES: alpha/beta hydrolase [Acidiplasma]|jgi:acetyl esterase|nr:MULTISPECIES: alpha/beta hydrolase [unclassified Acidiplasma]WMT55786.1 MAG: alpha/beta hydrolase [Acidiplasma sp.]